MSISMKNKILNLVSLFMATPLVAFAQEYPKGHGALEIFDAEGMAVTPTNALVWMAISLVWIALGLFFVRRHSHARWMVGGFISGFLFLTLSGVIFNRVELQLAGFLSLSHLIFWTPALYKLLKDRPFFSKPITAFSLWSGIMTLLIVVSYYFDIQYAFTYLNHIFFQGN